MGKAKGFKSNQPSKAGESCRTEHNRRRSMQAMGVLPPKEYTMTVEEAIAEAGIGNIS